MRRLEDKIRSLCARAVTTEGDEELKALLAELRDALHQHIERIRRRFGDYPAPAERRFKDEVPPLNQLPPVNQLPPETALPQTSPPKIKPIEIDPIQSEIKKISNGPNGALGS